MKSFTRRDFLRGSAAVAGALTTGVPLLGAPAKRSATDLVELGNSGVKVTRLAFGTGTFGGRVQRELGQEQFTKIVRHAYDRGIRFFETADAYTGMPQMLAAALKGIPRDSYKLMTKMRLKDGAQAAATIDRFRQDLNSEYFDILLLHCVRTATWSDDLKAGRDGLSEAKQKKIILAHGASCHGLIPIRTFPGNKWLDVALHRINHNGTRMDALREANDVKGNVDEVVSHVKKTRAQGTGVLGMKLVGEGQFTTPEDRQAALDFVFKLGVVDAVTIGHKSTAEIDESIDRINRALNA